MFGRPGMDDRVEQVVDITQVCQEKQILLSNFVPFLATFSSIPSKGVFFLAIFSLILVYESVHFYISRPGRQSEHWAGGQGRRLASRSLLSSGFDLILQVLSLGRSYLI